MITSTNIPPTGMSETEFKDAMLRIAIKGASMLNAIAESLARGTAAEEQQQEEKNEETDKTMANASTLNALMEYFGLPSDKLGISEALKAVIESGSKPNKVMK